MQTGGDEPIRQSFSLIPMNFDVRQNMIFNYTVLLESELPPLTTSGHPSWVGPADKRGGPADHSAEDQLTRRCAAAF